MPARISDLGGTLVDRLRHVNAFACDGAFEIYAHADELRGPHAELGGGP